MITTTLNRIRQHGPCATGWKKLLAHLGKTAADDEPLPVATILQSNGLDDALWCLRAEPQHSREWRLLAVVFARRVQHLMTDQRAIAALDVAARHANGQATDDELAAARDAAWDTASAAAAYAAADAAATAARDTASAAAWAAADAAATAAWAAEDAAATAARAAAWGAEARYAARGEAWYAVRAAMTEDFLAVAGARA